MKIPETPLRMRPAACSFSTPAVTTKTLPRNPLFVAKRMKSRAIALPQVIIQKNDIDPRLLECDKGLLKRVTVCHNLESRLACQEAGYAFPKQGMIVHDQDIGSLVGWITH